MTSPGAIEGGVSPGTRPQPLTDGERRDIAAFAARVVELRGELRLRIIGQDEVTALVLAAVLAEGHCLLVGVPGLAKTLLMSSLAELLSLTFKRLQFTPDLMPTDITGATIIRDDGHGRRDFHFEKGPIFANLVLADEINRTPPKTQAALMEAMEERQVSVAGSHFPLPRPFFILATQNPIEQEGTYPLPVTQLDRFLFNIVIDYPEVAEEYRMVVLTTSSYSAALKGALEADVLRAMLRLVRRVELEPRLLEYASRIIRSTRPSASEAPAFIKELVAWGAGPRATQSLINGARAMALMDGRCAVTAADIHRVVLPTLRHRIILRYHAQAEGVQADELLVRLLRSLPDGLYPPAETARPEPRGLFKRLLK
jgi:MoxR-like ATPase